MSGGDPIPILCTLARHHTGDHDEHGLAGKRPCGAVVRTIERAPEEQVPVVEVPAREPGAGGDTEDGHNHFGEIFVPSTCPGCAAMGAPDAPPSPPPVPAEPPSLAVLIEAMVRARNEEAAAAFELLKARGDAEDAISAVAHRIGRGQFVAIGGALFRSVQPRKVGGVVSEGALWTLVAVEVAK